MLIASLTSSSSTAIRSSPSEWNWPVFAFWMLFLGCAFLAVTVVRQNMVKPHPVVLFIWTLWMIWLGASTVWYRLDLELDGTVIASRDIPPTRGPRYATEYTLRGPDGRDQQYVAGATSDSLPRSMPVGTYLKKKKWQLSYERDGETVNDFFGVWPFWPAYAVYLCAVIGALALSFRIWRAERT